MWRGLARYSPFAFVVVLNVVPRSTSVAVTLAPGRTAPDESLTVPTMLPISFSPQATPPIKNRTTVSTQTNPTSLQGFLQYGVIYFSYFSLGLLESRES